MNRIARLRLLTLLVLATGCDGERGAADGTRGTTRSAAWPEGSAWTLSPSPVLAIGGTGSDSSSEFYDVAGATRLDDGRIVVADRGTFGLRFFDSLGEPLRITGGRGQGPGEFASIDGLARIRGDTLLVWDRASTRMSVFDSAGTFVASHLPEGLHTLPWFPGAFRDGTYVMSRGTDLSRATMQPGSIRQDTLILLRFGRDGRVLDTLGRFLDAETFVDVDGGTVTMERVIFGERYGVTLGPDHLFAGANTGRELTAYTPGGGPARTVRTATAPRSATSADVDAYRRHLLERDLGGAPSPVRAGAARRVAAIPHRSSLPTFGEIRADLLGYLWVERFRIPGAGTGSWDIFDPSGVWIGALDVSGGLRVHEIGADYLLGVARDELGVERVEIFHLERGRSDS